VKKYEIWCEKWIENDVMVAVVQRSGVTSVASIFQVRVRKIIYQRGYRAYGWKVGSDVMLNNIYLKQPKEAIRFMFEEI